MTSAQLSHQRQRLIALMRSVRFGRIENLLIQCGEPVLAPPPRIVREYKFGTECSQGTDVTITNFTLKSEIVELFRAFARLRDGKVDILELRHGLPFRLVITDALPELEQS